MQIPRIAGITRQQFVEHHILPNQPVIVTDAMQHWPARTLWNPDYFSARLAGLQVQVYNDLFDLTNVTTLDDYFDNHFDRPDGDASHDYVRWYSQLKDVDFFWSDEAFARLAPDWDTPYFLPTTGYLVPGLGEPVTPPVSLFPYRGLFISGRGARTRLHRDPWTTSAMLCQFYGSKHVTMYAPDQAPCLMAGEQFVDIRDPDPARFPRFGEARIQYEDELQPGEILFIPSGWLHHVESLQDSISVTWNFLHASGVERLREHLRRHPDDSEIDVMRFFLADLAGPQATTGDIEKALAAYAQPA
ncbi:cupin-like domain-containing protein [[Empedobacter] haloabium]|uniref:Cupin-like domain-containing protein n=1 Tax=[Empedobacter] haloabium TaxID=592317 RepID=A0ABZ1UJ93_9BURK